MPSCEVNQPIVERALGLRSNQTTKTQAQKSTDTNIISSTESPKSKSSWSFFGRRAPDGDRQIKVDSLLENEQHAHNNTSKNDRINKPVGDSNDEPAVSNSPEAKTTRSIFGKAKENDTALPDSLQHTSDTSSREQHTVGGPLHESLDAHHPSNSSPTENSRWHFFGKRHGDRVQSDKSPEKSYETFQKHEPAEHSCSIADAVDYDSEHPKTWCPHISPTSWSSVFGSRETKNESATNSNDANNVTVGHQADDCAGNDNTTFTHTEIPLDHDEFSRGAIEQMLTADRDAKEIVETSDVPPHGAFRTSIEIIRKTAETSSNIPKGKIYLRPSICVVDRIWPIIFSSAYSIGMVTGGVVGLALAGPAG
jgi:hypothetical protein